VFLVFEQAHNWRETRSLSSPSPSFLFLFPSSGVDGVDVVIGTSSFLREFSHGKDMAYIEKTAIEGELYFFLARFSKSSRASEADLNSSQSSTSSSPRVLRFDSRLRTPSDPTWSTSFTSTEPSTRLE